MKIAILVTVINSQGGVPRVASILANEFAKKEDVEVDVISVFKDENKLEFDFDNKVNLKYLNVDINLKVNKIKKQLVFAKAVNKAIIDGNYDVVLSTSAYINMYSVLYKDKNLKTKIIGSEHGAHSHLALGWRVVTNILYKRLDEFVLLTSKELNKYNKYVKNINVIPNMLTFESDSVSNLEKKNMIYVGRIDENKNVGNLIEVFNLFNKAIDDWTLTICGTGTEEDVSSVKEKISEYGLENKVIMKDFVKDIQKELLESSIFIMTTKSEGLPMAMIEASSVGLPCVSYDILTGPSDIIEDSKSGYLIEPFDKEEMSKKLIELAKDKEKLKEMGKRSKEISKKFEREFIVNQWMELFRKEVN